MMAGGDSTRLRDSLAQGMLLPPLPCVPDSIHLRQRGMFQFLPSFAEFFFDLLKSSCKFSGRAVQCTLGIDLEESCVIDEGEKEVAKFFFQVFMRPCLLRFMQLGNFFLHLLPNVFLSFPIEAHFGGFFLKPMRAEQ